MRNPGEKPEGRERSVDALPARPSSDSSRGPLTGCALALLVLYLLAGPAQAVTQITRAVISSGESGPPGAAHAILSTIGEPVVGGVTGVEHSFWSGFWTPPQVPAGVSEAETHPTAFDLYPGEPNPFSQLAAIRYDVPATGGAVALRIYDITGRLVRTLIDEVATPGRKTAVWDGRTDQGGRAGQGIYLVTFQAPGTSKTGKLVRIGGEH